MELLWIALATFVSEDLTCIGTGVLIAQGRIGWSAGVLACMAGIFGGDLLLYFAGRLLGRPLARRLIAEPKLDRAAAWLAERGAKMVLVSRFTPGLRLPTYLAAGLLRTRFWSFAGYFLLAAAVWTPLLVLGSAFLGERLPRTPMTVAFGLIALVQCVPRGEAGWKLRRRIVGWWRRKVRWEFWPGWAAYLPVIPYLLWLAVRHRSATLFTLANPGIPGGGFCGESKSEILAKLGPGLRFARLRPGVSPEDVEALGFGYPLVLKPDAGERGRGVAVIRDRDGLLRYLETAGADVIAQEYAGGCEFGVFYVCYPSWPAGRVVSITRKLFPQIVGDGVRTVEELILAGERSVCLARLYVERCGRAPDEVLARGERVQLVELGSHCRGSIFLNGADLATAELTAAVDRIARRHAGFYLGRFDVRAASEEALRRGEFAVLELNGVTSEPTHIYDPAVSLLDAYRALFTQWRMAFEIGAEVRARGGVPMPARELLRIVGACLWRG